MKVCCRVMVRDRYGVWTAVTDNLSSRGCCITTRRLLRAGTRLKITLSSDQLSEDLELNGTVAWTTDVTLGVNFDDGSNGSSVGAVAAWLDELIKVGETADFLTTHRVVPSVSRKPLVLATVSRFGFAAKPDEDPRPLAASGGAERVRHMP